MGKVILMLGGGGGADLDVITATASDVRAEKVIVDKDGNPVTGVLPERGNLDKWLGINETYYLTEGYYSGGTVRQSIPVMGGQTITPSASQQIVSCNGNYMTGDIVINPFIKTLVDTSYTATITNDNGTSVSYMISEAHGLDKSLICEITSTKKTGYLNGISSFALRCVDKNKKRFSLYNALTPIGNNADYRAFYGYVSIVQNLLYIYLYTPAGSTGNRNIEMRFDIKIYYLQNISLGYIRN